MKRFHTAPGCPSSIISATNQSVTVGAMVKKVVGFWTIAAEVIFSEEEVNLPIEQHFSPVLDPVVDGVGEGLHVALQLDVCV